MEGESEGFLKVLQNRSRNFVKKLERIKKKQIELKSSTKEIKEEEKKLIESGPLVEELLQENEKIIELFKKHLETLQQTKEKPVEVKEDKSKDVANLWALSEFFTSSQVKEKYLSDYPSDEQDLEALLLIHSSTKGKVSQTFSSIREDFFKHVELFIEKSKKNIQDSGKTYSKIEELSQKATKWALNQQVPPLAKVELSVQSSHIYSSCAEKPEKTEKIVEETQEEIKVPVEEPKKIQEIAQSEPEEKLEEKKSEVVSRWAEDNDDELEEENKVEIKEDDGFTTVTGRKKPQNKPPETERRARGRGRRGRGGRFKDDQNKEYRNKSRGESS